MAENFSYDSKKLQEKAENWRFLQVPFSIMAYFLISDKINFMKKIIFILFSIIFSFILISCSKDDGMELSEIEALTQQGHSELLSKCVYKPWNGGTYADGKAGGTWYTTILDDPKTFNQLIGERDGQSSALISETLDYLFDYDSYTREWKAEAADFKIETDEKSGILTVHCKLRDDMFWSFYDSDKKIPVTSDDIVFWYNEIAGDEQFASSSYGSQWVTMPDGSENHIDCVKIDDKNFDFVFPRIVADPLLACNMSLCPSFIFREAKEKNGADGVKNLFSVNSDPKTIPSCGRFFITEYSPSQRLVFTRNPDYWKKDSRGYSMPYYDQMICQIVGDMNTDYLLFKEGKTETYNPRPEEVSDVVNAQGNDYTVFAADGSMGASLWSFNQNPVHKDEPYYKWFTKKEFRQAMSCLLNRDRIINQTYRGLAQPKYDFFPEANPYYNADITLKYRFDIEKAEKLLKSAGFEKKSDGFLYDDENHKVEFDLTIPSSNTIFNDIAQILVDEAKKAGVTITIRQTDFQKVVEMLTSTFDWQSVFIGLGSNLFPSQGSNVWPSNGNLHLWYPYQESPATDWEARVDYLYNEGCYTNDKKAAKKIWDEYQELLLEECPVIYLLRSRSFFAIRNKWDLTNVYYDNLNGAKTEFVFIK